MASTHHPERYQFGYRLLLSALVLCVSGCAAPGVQQEAPNPDIFSYRYLSFNFSGQGWNDARSRCAERGKKAKHLATQCGFLMCTTEVECVIEPAPDS